MRLFEVKFYDGVTRIVFGESADRVQARMISYGFTNFSVCQIIIT